MGEYFFLDQDDSCHWYIVPHMQRKAWGEWRDLPADDERGWEVPEYAQVLGGGPQSVIFLVPKEIERYG